ncbi:MAG: hypothetical protein ACKOGH_12755 [Alphaproteobacteria bacterium]
MDEQTGPRTPYRRMLALMRYRGLVGGDVADAMGAQQKQFEDVVGQMLEDHARTVERLTAQAVSQIPNQAARDLVSGTIGAQFEMQRQAMEIALRQAEDMASHAWRAYGDFAAMLGRSGLSATKREPGK